MRSVSILCQLEDRKIHFERAKCALQKFVYPVEAYYLSITIVESIGNLPCEDIRESIILFPLENRPDQEPTA